jgi:zinc protease
VGRPGADADSLEAALLEEMEGIVAHLDDAALERVRATAAFGLTNQLQQLGGFGGRGDVLAEGLLFHGDAGWINRRLPALAAVTADELRALAAERLVPENRAVLLFVPARAEENR